MDIYWQWHCDLQYHWAHIFGDRGILPRKATNLIDSCDDILSTCDDILSSKVACHSRMESSEICSLYESVWVAVTVRTRQEIVVSFSLDLEKIFISRNSAINVMFSCLENVVSVWMSGTDASYNLGLQFICGWLGSKYQLTNFSSKHQLTNFSSRYPYLSQGQRKSLNSLPGHKCWHCVS